MKVASLDRMIVDLPRPTRSPLALTYEKNVPAPGTGTARGRSRMSAVRVWPPAAAEMVTTVSTVTARLTALNVTLLAPVAIGTELGTVTRLVFWLDNVTTTAEGPGTGLSRWTVAAVVRPPSKDGSTWSRSRAGGAGDLRTSVAVRVSPPAEALSVTVVSDATGCVETAKDCAVLPGAIVSVAGTEATDAVVDKLTANPELGAPGPASVT
jgi:hypothetical protein